MDSVEEILTAFISMSIRSLLHFLSICSERERGEGDCRKEDKITSVADFWDVNTTRENGSEK